MPDKDLTERTAQGRRYNVLKRIERAAEEDLKNGECWEVDGLLTDYIKAKENSLMHRPPYAGR